MDSALEKAVVNNTEYQRTSTDLDKILKKVEKIKVTDEEAHTLDRAFSLYNEQASIYAALAYKLGFFDCCQMEKQAQKFTEEDVMVSVIEELFNGNIRPIKEFQPILDSYKIKWEKIMKVENDFVGKLEGDLKEEFEHLMDEHFDLVPLEMSEVYAIGFKMGTRMMCEVFFDKDEQ